MWRGAKAVPPPVPCTDSNRRPFVFQGHSPIRSLSHRIEDMNLNPVDVQAIAAALQALQSAAAPAPVLAPAAPAAPQPHQKVRLIYSTEPLQWNLWVRDFHRIVRFNGWKN